MEHESIHIAKLEKQNWKILHGLRKEISPYLRWPIYQVIFWHFYGNPKFPMRRNGVGKSAPWIAYTDAVDEWVKSWTQGKVKLTREYEGEKQNAAS